MAQNDKQTDTKQQQTPPPKTGNTWEIVGNAGVIQAGTLHRKGAKLQLDPETAERLNAASPRNLRRV